MKNALNFNIPFNPLSNTDFINCFASAYMFVEDIDVSGAVAECKNGNSVCVGCGVGCNDSPASKQARWFFLFDTVTGLSSVRRRYGGEPSQMERLTGHYDDISCSSDYTVDFLFGFAGYKYRKVTEPSTFKVAIVKSIDAGRPVLAKVKGYFHVITGYDDDVLIIPDYANAQNKPSTPEYGDLESLYIIGEKEVPRYLLKDGLERIKQMMELNAYEKIWDSYIDKLWECIILPRDDEFKKLDPEEQRVVMTELKDAAWCAWTIHNLGQALASRHHEEMRNPAFTEVWEQITDRCKRSVELGHAVSYFYGKIDWTNIHASTRSGIGSVLLMMVERYKEIDAELLELVKQAIAIAKNL